MDQRPHSDVVAACRFVFCETYRTVFLAPAGETTDHGDRWATVADIPAVWRQ